MTNKEAAYKKISELTKRFSEQIGSYKKSEYNETLTRRDFIDPFFKSLGWDIDNELGNAEAYREVIHEDKIKIGSATKAPDYSFRLPGGKRLFFVEAKKPSVFVKEEIPPAYQVRRYGWSSKLPISIVTDFEEFAIYDCTKKPKATDRASTARIKYILYSDYLREFDFIWDTFSKERVLQGSFDKFVLSDRGKKGTATVDKEFLESLNEWRKALAETISLNNRKLNEDQLNFAVQQTLDRIIFLRISEDRGVEPYGKLKHSLNKGNYYKNIFEYFEEADKKYNSGLFDLSKDNISHNLTIDNKIIKKIIDELYYPESPYEFSVLSVEILGSAYEQFLGKQIKLTASHKAKIEEKPEVRKAGGVYYTPQYIVEYIVKNTVGKLVEGKTPKEVEKLKIVDPACGSGSFLIGAYQYLLDWHLSYYMGKAAQHPDSPKASHPLSEGNKRLLTPDGRLTTAEKKRILINNIYRVDIDTQAVEVTKLSLLLKCMEGETQASVQQTMSFMHERVLPTLENNIKSGNSLIDLDFYDGELGFEDHPAPAKAGSPLLGKEGSIDKKIKPFNWQSSFPEVFKHGGFDCVIGNPPYIRSQHLENIIKNYLVKNYESASYQPDTFAFFINKGILLLRNQGLLGLIIPNGILTNVYYAKLRKYILENTAINVIVDLKDNVFEGASVDTSIFILKREIDFKNILNHAVAIGEAPSKLIRSVITPKNKVTQSKLLNIHEYNFNTNIDTESITIFESILNNSINLEEYCVIKNGMKVRKEFIADKNVNNKYKKFLLGSSIRPYEIEYKNKWVCYDKNLETKYTNQAFRDEKIFIAPKKLLVRQVMGKNRIYGTIDLHQYYVDQSIYILLPLSKIVDLKYILGIINSHLMNYYFSKIFSDRKITFPKIKGVQISKLPICKVDFSNPAEKKKHDEIVKHVETMLELNKEQQKAKMPEEQEQLKQRISYTDKKIDKLVYELYGLTEEEIKVVEGEK